MPVGNSQQPEIIAFTQERIGSRHITARNDRSAPDRQEVNDHKRDEKDGQQKKRNDHRTRVHERLQDGL